MTIAAPPALCISVLLAFAQAGSTLKPDAAIECSDCPAWNRPQDPARIFGNSYYVGTAGLTAVLITTDAGLILLDGALPQSAPLIDRNIRRLGFRIEDVRPDRQLACPLRPCRRHRGAAARQRRRRGRQRGGGAGAGEGRAHAGRSPGGLRPRGECLPGRAGGACGGRRRGGARRPGLASTAHLTPGHTPGSTTWTWESCEGTRCLNLVYADSLSAVAAPGFRFTGGGGTSSLVDTFQRSIARVEQLPCDIFLPTHPTRLRTCCAGSPRVAGRRPTRSSTAAGAAPTLRAPGRGSRRGWRRRRRAGCSARSRGPV